MKAGKTEDGLRLLNLANNLEPNNPYVVAARDALNMAGYYQDALTRLQKARKIGASDDVVLGRCGCHAVAGQEPMCWIVSGSRFWRHLFGRHDSRAPGPRLCRYWVIAAGASRQ